jgi:hypothetical protein
MRQAVIVLGFGVTTRDGSQVRVPATNYDVDDHGALVLRVGEQQVRTLAPGSWIAVEPIGTPMTTVWPPDNLSQLLAELDSIVGPKYGNYERVGTAADFDSPRLNEIEAFLDEAGRRIGRDPGSTDRDNVQLFGDLRAAVRRHLT